MPAPHPPEFHARAVELARERAKPIAQIAKDLGISKGCLRNWLNQADIDSGRREGLSTDERAELVRCGARSVRSRWRSKSSSAPQVPALAQAAHPCERSWSEH